MKNADNESMTKETLPKSLLNKNVELKAFPSNKTCIDENIHKIVETKVMQLKKDIFDFTSKQRTKIPPKNRSKTPIKNIFINSFRY